MVITTATAQNRRAYQEDRFFTEEINGGLLFGVYDGHGGDWVAEYAVKHTPYLFKAFLKYTKLRPQTILSRITDRLDGKTRFCRSGSTASTVWIDKNRKWAYVSIIGDSPVIILKNDSTIWVSPEHNVRNNPKEAEWIMKMRGGIIHNGYVFSPRTYQGVGLQMTRALGDYELDDILNRKPEIFKIPINKNSWILCGSDGVLNPEHIDISDNVEQMRALISIPTTKASDLINYAYQTGSEDNITAILVKVSQ